MKRRLLRWPAIATPRPGAPLPPLRARLIWMLGIWAASIAVLLLVAVLLRMVLKV
ncbi:DUF2474 family protein [Variovorax boronicumulans]|uniref:DUF2474 family protein n=1 Tax=Variovorax boronicumulans TaxID=436515 RepID=UPI003393324B